MWWFELFPCWVRSKSPEWNGLSLLVCLSSALLFVVLVWFDSTVCCVRIWLLALGRFAEALMHFVANADEVNNKRTINISTISNKITTQKIQTGNEAACFDDNFRNRFRLCAWRYVYQMARHSRTKSLLLFSRFFFQFCLCCLALSCLVLRCVFGLVFIFVFVLVW